MSSAATSPGAKAAQALREKLGAAKVVLPGEPLPDLGKYGTDFYFTAQAAEVSNACRVLPTNTDEVVAAVNAVREAGATFAVKSGGHGTYASGANAEDGVTIDLSRLKDITIASDRKSVFVDGGCRWGEVMEKLGANGLGCVGGRISSVGVGGLTLGGGISFTSSERGLACDNVKSYELVLPSGKVLNITKETHADLAWAMKGAGIAFGIITRFELNTFDLGNIWGGSQTFPNDNETSVFTTFHKFVTEVPDTSAEAFLICTDVAKDGKPVFTFVLSRSLPEDDPPVFHDLKSMTPLVSTTQVRSLKSLCDEIDSANQAGRRFMATAQAVACDLPTLKDILGFHAEAARSLAERADFMPSLLYQPLLPVMLPKDGSGNALGVKPEDGPLIVICLLWSWSSKNDDADIRKIGNDFMANVEKAARHRGTWHRYQYANYADGHQNPFVSYGEENRKRLMEIQTRYDPEGLMEKLRPGIFKLSGL